MIKPGNLVRLNKDYLRQIGNSVKFIQTQRRACSAVSVLIYPHGVPKTKEDVQQLWNFYDDYLDSHSSLLGQYETKLWPSDVILFIGQVHIDVDRQYFGRIFFFFLHGEKIIFVSTAVKDNKPKFNLEDMFEVATEVEE